MMQTNKIQIMDDMMRNLQRGDGISNLRALQQMRQIKQPSPVNKNIYMAKGGFPDLSGDGQITQRDILIGRGVIERRYGGLAGLPEVQAFGGFNPFKPIRRAGKKITRGARRLAGAAKDVVDSGLSGISNALGGGKGTGDFLKTLALMAVTNMILPGSGLTGLSKAALAAGKAYVVPSLATGGFNELTSDPFRQDKLLRAALAGGITYGAEKLGGPPQGTTDNLEADIAEFDTTPGVSETGVPKSGTGVPFTQSVDAPQFAAESYMKPGPIAQFKADYITPAVDATKEFVSNVADTKLPTIGAPYDVADLTRDAASSYGATEIKKEVDAIKKMEQDAKGAAEALTNRMEAEQRSAAEFARLAMEDPVLYNYVYKYADNPEAVVDIVKRMTMGADDIQTAQMFEPATYTTESGRRPGELTAAYGGGISTIVNNALGQNQQFANGMVPNTVDPRSDGMSDSETMLITDKTGQDPKGIMKISEEEYVISAPDMALLGNGSARAGAQKLDNFRKNLREMAYGTTRHQPRIDGNKALQSLMKG